MWHFTPSKKKGQRKCRWPFVGMRADACLRSGSSALLDYASKERSSAVGVDRNYESYWFG
jgi:hypothetical protein